MWPINRKESEFEPVTKIQLVTKYSSELNIIFYQNSPDGTKLKLSVSTSKLDGSKPENPHKDFLHWYHGRKYSECFVVKMIGVSRMIKRKDIFSYEIKTKKEKIRKYSDCIFYADD